MCGMTQIDVEYQTPQQILDYGKRLEGMTDGRREFCMGNALVVGVPHRIGEVLARESRGLS